MKRALITGITGQDGSYLAELLLEKGYEVHGVKRRASLFNTQRVDHLYQDPQTEHNVFKLHYGDLSDTSNITRLLRDIEPDEVYNLGAQSHVGSNTFFGFGKENQILSSLDIRALWIGATDPAKGDNAILSQITLRCC